MEKMSRKEVSRILLASIERKIYLCKNLSEEKLYRMAKNTLEAINRKNSTNYDINIPMIINNIISRC